MGKVLDKLKRMQTARTESEDPLVDALNSHPGITAWVNSATTAKENRIQGDVFFYVKKEEWTGAADDGYSVESQVAKPGNTNFSYGTAKVESFRGREYKKAFVHLSCSETKDGDDKIHMIVPATAFHDFLKNDMKPFEMKCKTCKGSGAVQTKFENVGSVEDIVMMPCDGCEGKGKIPQSYYLLKPEIVCSALGDMAIVEGSIEDAVSAFVSRNFPRLNAVEKLMAEIQHQQV